MRASGPGVLRRVLQRFHAAVVDGRLDLGRVAADPAAGHLDRARAATPDGAQRGQEPALGEQAREDPVREVAQLLDRLVELALELAEPSSWRRGRRRSPRSRSRAGCAGRRGAAARRRGGRARAGAARARSPRRSGCASRADPPGRPSRPLRARRSPARAARSRPPPAAAPAPPRAGRRARSRPRPARRAGTSVRTRPDAGSGDSSGTPWRRPTRHRRAGGTRAAGRIAERSAQHRLELARRRAPQRLDHDPAQHPAGEQLRRDEGEQEAVPDRGAGPDDRPLEDRVDVAGLRAPGASPTGTRPARPGRRARPARRSPARGGAAACRRRAARRSGRSWRAPA